MKDIQDEIVKEITNELVSKLERLVINGLKLKGFEFNTKLELEIFIKERCKRIDNVEFEEHIYYVDDVPFFLHKYKVAFNPIIDDGNSIKIYVNYGEYSFL